MSEETDLNSEYLEDFNIDFKDLNELDDAQELPFSIYERTTDDMILPENNLSPSLDNSTSTSYTIYNDDTLVKIGVKPFTTEEGNIGYKPIFALAAENTDDTGSVTDYDEVLTDLSENLVDATLLITDNTSNITINANNISTLSDNLETVENDLNTNISLLDRTIEAVYDVKNYNNLESPSLSNATMTSWICPSVNLSPVNTVNLVKVSHGADSTSYNTPLSYLLIHQTDETDPDRCRVKFLGKSLNGVTPASASTLVEDVYFYFDDLKIHNIGTLYFTFTDGLGYLEEDTTVSTPLTDTIYSNGDENILEHITPFRILTTSELGNTTLAQARGYAPANTTTNSSGYIASSSVSVKSFIPYIQLYHYDKINSISAALNNYINFTYSEDMVNSLATDGYYINNNSVYDLGSINDMEVDSDALDLSALQFNSNSYDVTNTLDGTVSYSAYGKCSEAELRFLASDTTSIQWPESWTWISSIPDFSTYGSDEKQYSISLKYYTTSDGNNITVAKWNATISEFDEAIIELTDEIYTTTNASIDEKVAILESEINASLEETNEEIVLTNELIEETKDDLLNERGLLNYYGNAYEYATQEDSDILSKLSTNLYIKPGSSISFYKINDDCYKETLETIVDLSGLKFNNTKKTIVEFYSDIVTLNDKKVAYAELSMILPDEDSYDTGFGITWPSDWIWTNTAPGVDSDYDKINYANKLITIEVKYSPPLYNSITDTYYSFAKTTACVKSIEDFTDNTLESIEIGIGEALGEDESAVATSRVDGSQSYGFAITNTLVQSFDVDYIKSITVAMGTSSWPSTTYNRRLAIYKYDDSGYETTSLLGVSNEDSELTYDKWLAGKNDTSSTGYMHEFIFDDLIDISPETILYGLDFQFVNSDYIDLLGDTIVMMPYSPVRVCAIFSSSSAWPINTITRKSVLYYATTISEVTAYNDSLSSKVMPDHFTSGTSAYFIFKGYRYQN